METGGQKYYYHYDVLGSVVALSEENGAEAETYRYTPYGKALETGRLLQYFLVQQHNLLPPGFLEGRAVQVPLLERIPEHGFADGEGCLAVFHLKIPFDGRTGA